MANFDRVSVNNFDSVKNAVIGYTSVAKVKPTLLDMGDLGIMVKRIGGACEFELMLLDMVNRGVIKTVFCDSVLDGLNWLSVGVDDCLLDDICSEMASAVFDYENGMNWVY